MQSSTLLARGAPAVVVPRLHALLPSSTACSTSGLRCAAVVVPSSRRSPVLLRTRATNNGNSSNGSNGNTPGTSTTTTTDSGYVSDVEDCDNNLGGEYCTLDDNGKRVKGKRTIGEMENDFLSALSSWYYDGKPAMNDDEFELLKDELLWAGSKVPILDGDEKRFLEASMSYARGKPIMPDDEYDALKASLKMKASVVAAEGPRCSIRSKKMYSDATPDYLKMTFLNIPGALFILGILFGIDLLTGLEVSALIQLPPPYGVAVLWGLVLPVLFVISYGLTQIGFKDNIILKGPCPNCGSENFTYFGDIFTVPGNRGQNQVECGSCKAGLSYDENKRIIVVDEMPEERIKRAAAAAAKKAAAAAKKKAKVMASMDN